MLTHSHINLPIAVYQSNDESIPQHMHNSLLLEGKTTVSICFVPILSWTFWWKSPGLKTILKSWRCSHKTVMKTYQNTHEINAEDGRKAPPVCVCIFNVQHKLAITSDEHNCCHYSAFHWQYKQSLCSVKLAVCSFG